MRLGGIRIIAETVDAVQAETITKSKAEDRSMSCSSLSGSVFSLHHLSLDKMKVDLLVLKAVGSSDQWHHFVNPLTSH